MANNNVNADAQLQRMKALMNYGINESKQPVYSTIEYNKVAADGKLYGIVREGTNYFIKVAKNPKGNLVSENFEYIGGFRNRKDNMFESFAAAQRYFGEKMININEEVGSAQKQVIAENYINEKKDVIAEQTEKMQMEIARQRQIMENAQNIMEKKAQCCEPVKGEGTDKNSKSPKCDAKECDEEVKDYNGKPMKGGAGAPFTEGPKEIKESAETPLSSRNNPDFIDKSHGTEIGKNTGFGKPVENHVEGSVAEENGGESEMTDTPENVNEEAAMHDSQSQNTPAPGTNEKGDQAPFDEKANMNEALDDVDDELDDEVDGDELDDTDSFDGEEFGDDADLEDAEDTVDADAAIAEDADDDIAARMDSLEAKLDSILDAINNMKYDDDEELYDDDKDMDDSEEEDAPIDADETEGFEEEPEEDDVNVVESKSYRKMRKMNEENRLDDFGKHPAYQKKVMTLPQNQNQKSNGQYDMNDSSVDGEQPYGTQKGSQAPFDQERETIENEIVESVMKIVKKKLG